MAVGTGTLRILALTLLGGCPFLFEPPDLSRVDGPPVGEADTDTDTDVDTDTDTDTEPTAETGISPDAPTVLSFEAAPHILTTTFLFSVADLQQDFSGGRLTVTDGTVTEVFEIPADIPDFNGNGLNRVRIDRPAGWIDCESDLHETWTLVITDRAGHDSAPATAPLDVVAQRLPETGNQPHDPWPGGTPPFVACVTRSADPLDATPAGIQLANDYEFVRFELPSGTFRTELAWEARIGIWFTVAELPPNYPYACDLFPAGNLPAVAGCTFESQGGEYVMDPYWVGWDNTQDPASFEMLFVVGAD